ncbi:MAG: FAD:protein FMN transferase [Bacteroidetes bacterium]|nr:FAD:protein FMN transferase [Bacteroidota bacterium]
MKLFYLYAFTLFFLFSCTKPKLVKIYGFAQGTTYSISYYDKNGVEYGSQIDSILNVFNKSVSIYDSLSLITFVNKSSEPVKADKFFIEIFENAQKVSEETNGAFDITVAPLVNAFGFGFKNKEKLDSSHIDSLKKLVNFRYVIIKNGYIYKQYPSVALDFNAIAQGYSVDLISDFLENKGVKNYIVEIGGEVYAKGKKDDGKYWNVGIEKPLYNDLQREIKAKVKIENKALATSGNYHKYYVENGVKYSHIIDPSTGYPVTHSLLSVSVIADNCTKADAYATSFMVMGLNKSLLFLKNHKEFEAYFIYSDKEGNMKTYETEGLKELLTEQKY